MVVMILEKVPTSLRGNLTRWLVEPHPGIFVGKISALVRDELWNLCLETRAVGGLIQIWSAANEQGLDIRSFGKTTRQLVDFDGLWLVRKPHKEQRNMDRDQDGESDKTDHGS